MISIGNWSLRLIPENRRINKFHNYKEWFFIYYKGGLCGTLQLCDIDKRWWVHILDEHRRKQFYKDNEKFKVKNIIKCKNDKFAIQTQRYVLADELVKLCNLELDIRKNENDLYCKVIIGDVFNVDYKEKVTNKQIIKDLKSKYPSISNFISDSQIKKSIIKIFQVQDLKLNLNCRCCKTRKSGLLWDLCNF